MTRSSWRDWRTVRDRLLTSPGFQRWAAAFPMTRPIARRRARELFDLCAGFVYSQVLLACVRLNLFEELASGPRSVRTLASNLQLEPEKARRLLRAAAALQLVEPRGDDRYGLGKLGAPLVGNAGLRALIEHHTALYQDLQDPLQLLRDGDGETALSRYWAYATNGHAKELDADRIAGYTELMAASQAAVAEQILSTYSFRKHRCLLDVGGGNGTFCLAAARSHPALQLMLFDLPAVAAIAEERFRSAGIASRSRAFAGSFLTDPLPDGADVVSLVRVVHDHSDEDAVRLLKSVRNALPEDGVLVLAEQLSGTRGAEPVGDAYFGIYLLAMGRGKPRTLEELSRLLVLAGFYPPREFATPLPLQTRVLVARPRIGQ